VARASRHAAIAAVLLALAAMALYPGGSPSDRSARRYSVLQNSLSDLGAAVTVNGERNRASAISFGASGIALAVAWALCLLRMLRVADPRSRTRVRAAATMGLAACVGLAAAVVTPEDVNPSLHLTLSFLSAVSLGGAIASVALAALADHRTPRRVLFASIVLLGTLLLWLLAIRLSPAIVVPTAPILLQKLLALALVVAVFLQTDETGSRA
jgi:hypothetical protein